MSKYIITTIRQAHLNISMTHDQFLTRTQSFTCFKPVHHLLATVWYPVVMSTEYRCNAWVVVMIPTFGWMSYQSSNIIIWGISILNNLIQCIAGIHQVAALYVVGYYGDRGHMSHVTLDCEWLEAAIFVRVNDVFSTLCVTWLIPLRTWHGVVSPWWFRTSCTIKQYERLFGDHIIFTFKILLNAVSANITYHTLAFCQHSAMT